MIMKMSEGVDMTFKG